MVLTYPTSYTFKSDGYEFVGRRPPRGWVNPYTGRTYDKPPRIVFNGEPNVYQRNALARYNRLPTAKNFFKLKNLGALFIFGALDWQTINLRNKIIFPNSNMNSRYGGLYQYKHTPRGVAYTTKTFRKRKGKKASTNSKNKNNRKKQPRKQTVAKVLNKQILDLRKKVNIGKAHHTRKQLASGRVLASVGLCNHALLNAYTLSNLEANMSALRYYNPSAPATLVTADASTGTYSRDVMIKYIYSKMEFKNNYQSPVHLKVYLCKVKGHTADDPLTLLTNNDQVISYSGITDPQVYLTEIENIRQVWNVDCVVDKILLNGQTASCSHSEKDIQYDPSHGDEDSTAYQKHIKSFCWIMRVEGVLGHDTSLDQQTTLQAGIDYQNQKVIKFEYEAGINLNDIHVTDSRDSAFTNGGVTGTYSVPDNIGYSVS